MPLQVCAAGPPQGMRGVTPVQLLPRGHCCHMDGLLWELHHLRAKLRQWVECYDRPGDHPAWLTHHVRRPVRLYRLLPVTVLVMRWTPDVVILYAGRGGQTDFVYDFKQYRSHMAKQTNCCWVPTCLLCLRPQSWNRFQCFGHQLFPFCYCPLFSHFTLFC